MQLEEWGTQLSSEPRSSGRHWRYDTEELWNALSYASMVRGNQKRLVTSLERAIRVCAPKCLVGPLLDRLQEGKSLPNRSTIQYNELALDFALVDLRRQQFLPDAFRHLKSDSSSTRRGFDWFWMELQEVAKNDVISVVRAFFQLKHLLDQMPTLWQSTRSRPLEALEAERGVEDPFSSFKKEIATHCQILRTKVRHHIFPPCAMASGFRSQVHKMECMAHNFHFDSPHNIPLQQYDLIRMFCR